MKSTRFVLLVGGITAMTLLSGCARLSSGAAEGNGKSNLFLGKWAREDGNHSDDFTLTVTDLIKGGTGRTPVTYYFVANVGTGNLDRKWSCLFDTRDRIMCDRFTFDRVGGSARSADNPLLGKWKEMNAKSPDLEFTPTEWQRFKREPAHYYFELTAMTGTGEAKTPVLMCSMHEADHVTCQPTGARFARVK